PSCAGSALLLGSRTQENGRVLILILRVNPNRTASARYRTKRCVKLTLRVRSSIRECLGCGPRTTNLGRISRYSQTKESDSSDSSFLLWKDWFRHFGNYLHARRLEILRDLIRTRDGSSALDVGCAAGILKAMGLSGVL